MKKKKKRLEEIKKFREEQSKRHEKKGGEIVIDKVDSFNEDAVEYDQDKEEDDFRNMSELV